MRHLPNGAARHSDGSFDRCKAPNLVNCGSTGSYGPRLGRRGGSCGFFLVGLFFCLRHCWYLVLFTTLFLFFLTVSMENSHPGLDEGHFSLSFKWTHSTSLRLAEKDPFAAALLDKILSSVGLSREQSSSSERLLFSASDVEESDNEGEGYKQKNANLDAVLDFVPCSQPDSDEGMSHHDHSPLKNLADASVNRSGQPMRAASLGLAQYLVAVREAASSWACVEAGPRGLWTKSQKRRA